jgi:hypothetical protein
VSSDAAYECELRSERDELLAAYWAIHSRRGLLDFQLKLAAAIQAREPAAFRSKNRDAKEHLRLLRILGDGLAWRLLHPYVVRQLAKNSAPPPALGNQGIGFQRTLDRARELSEAGHLMLVSDLTHVVTIGDLVVCDDREHPRIIECGGHEKFLHKGRKGRQFQRALAVTDLLTDGVVVFPGNRQETRTVVVKTPHGSTWPVVDRVTTGAERDGSVAEFATDADLVIAMRSDIDPKSAMTRETTDHMAVPTVAVYTRLLERPDPRVPPCTAWDVSSEATRLLYQGDVRIVHVIDAAAFVGRRRGNAEIVKLLRSDDAVAGFGVAVGDDRVSLAPEFLTDVLLGFQTIESTAEAMLEAAQLSVELAGGPGPQSASTEHIDRLSGLADGDGFVSPLLGWGVSNGFLQLPPSTRDADDGATTGA